MKRTPIRQKAVKKPPTAGESLKVDRVPVRHPARTGEFSPRVKKEVWRRAMGWCEMPGCTRTGSEYHHRLMRSHGGPGIVENCLLLCLHCHHYVHHGGMTTMTEVGGETLPLSYARGWIIRSGVEGDAMKALGRTG